MTEPLRTILGTILGTGVIISALLLGNWIGGVFVGQVTMIIVFAICIFVVLGWG